MSKPKVSFPCYRIVEMEDCTGKWLFLQSRMSIYGVENEQIHMISSEGHCCTQIVGLLERGAKLEAY